MRLLDVVSVAFNVSKVEAKRLICSSAVTVWSGPPHTRIFTYEGKAWSTLTRCPHCGCTYDPTRYVECPICGPG